MLAANAVNAPVLATRAASLFGSAHERPRTAVVTAAVEQSVEKPDRLHVAVAVDAPEHRATSRGQPGARPARAGGGCVDLGGIGGQVVHRRVGGFIGWPGTER